MKDWYRGVFCELSFREVSFGRIKMGRSGRLRGVSLGIRAQRRHLVSALTVCSLIWPALALAGSGDTAPARCLIPQGETTIMRTTDLATGRSFMDTTRITCLREGNPPFYVVRCTGGEKTTLIWMSGDDLQPSRYQLVGRDGAIERQIDFSEQSLRIAVKGESDARIVETSGSTHNGSTLLQYLRAFAGQGRPDRVEMKLLVDRGQNAFRIVDVYAQLICEEDVVVPGGTFHCVKIEFGLTGIIGRLFWRTRYHYFYTAEAPHHFVKYVDPDGECIELIGYECVEKVNTSIGD